MRLGSSTHSPPGIMMGSGGSCNLTQSSGPAQGTDSEGSSGMLLSSPATTMQKLRCMVKRATVGTREIQHIFLTRTFDIRASGFTNLIVMCQKSNEWKKAVEIFETMRDYDWGGVRPNIYSYTALVGVCCASGVPEKAIVVMRDMMAVAASGVDKSLEPDVTIYEKIIKACSRCGRHKLVLEMYWAIVRKQIVINQCILEAVFHGCLHLAKLKDALDRLQDLFLEYTIDSTMCTTFLEAAAGHESYEFVLDAFLTIQLWGVEVNPEMCEAVMSSIRTAGQPEDGLHLLKEMYTAGIEPTVKTYNALLWTLAAGGQCHQSVEVYEGMKQCGVCITHEGCKAVLRACRNAGEIKLCSVLTEEFARIGVYPDKCPTKRRRRSPHKNCSKHNLSFNSSNFGSGFVIGTGSSGGLSTEWLSGTETPSPTAMTYWEEESTYPYT